MHIFPNPTYIAPLTRAEFPVLISENTRTEEAIEESSRALRNTAHLYQQIEKEFSETRKDLENIKIANNRGTKLIITASVLAFSSCLAILQRLRGE